MATSRDLIHFERQGLIVPILSYADFHRIAECNVHLNEKYKRFHVQSNIDERFEKKILLSDKNVMFFPRKINGKFFFLHRIRPDIQIASVAEIKDLNQAYWSDYLMHFDQHILMAPKFEHEISYIGGGCPPIETKAGWLLIYHGVHDTVQGYVYSACAALLDLEDPGKELARLPYPLIKPEKTWELSGEVHNVVFPTGTALFDNTLYIYYGAADTRIAVASLNINDLIEELLKISVMRNSEFLLISSYPPRKCGIATYSQDLINAIEDKYQEGFSLKVCALVKEDSDLNYSSRVAYVLKTWLKEDYASLAQKINLNKQIRLVFLQHEFGLYEGELGDYLLDFLKGIKVPVIVTFHTILSKPDDRRRFLVRQIVNYAARVIVMTNNSAMILRDEYKIELDKLKAIPHGTHLIKPQKPIQGKYRPFFNKKILATFGLISEGKSIETALDALPRIVQHFPEVLYLIIGKTHPEVLKQNGENYRNFLQQKTIDLGIDKHVLFINKYLSLQILLDYLERVDIYLFTSKDPQQAVSGTLAYAMSAGCPVISTPIPHSIELLDGAGVNFEFEDAEGLADAALGMLSQPDLMQKMFMNALHKISPTAWQNSAIAHIELAKEVLKKENFKTQYRYPEISLDQVKRMSTEFGMLQFSKVAKPDKTSGYTLDDNARALIAVAKNFEYNGDFEDLHLINTYLKFILFCQQENGTFLNYVRYNKKFYKKNHDENLEDANGRAIWALGQFLSMQNLISLPLQARVEEAFQKALPTILDFQSPRAISFCIKGLYFHYQFKESAETLALITQLADNLLSKYRGVSSEKWQWYEPYLSYANAVLPEAMLLAGICTKSDLFKNTAKTTFDFLLSLTHDQEQISVISNVGRHDEGQEKVDFGQQPIEFAYTILALDSFYQEYREEAYLQQLKPTFDWFLGDNHLHQIIYNPCTGGCYDGLEEDHVNLNQGAESTLSYLLSRLTLEKYNL